MESKKENYYTTYIIYSWTINNNSGYSLPNIYLKNSSGTTSTAQVNNGSSEKLTMQLASSTTTVNVSDTSTINADLYINNTLFQTNISSGSIITLSSNNGTLIATIT
jgi:fructose-1,6-bisphosphatase